MKSAYTKIPNLVIESLGLSPSLLRTLLVLFKLCYGSKPACWPSRKYLAKATGLALRTITLHLSILEKAGFIQCFPRPGKVTFIVLTLKAASPDLLQSIARGVVDLHPLARKKTLVKDWMAIIHASREKARMGG